MTSLQPIQGIDIYLLDQFLKGRLSKGMNVFDAGCGYGRNIRMLLDQGYHVTAMDANPEPIGHLQAEFPEIKDRFFVGRIESLLTGQTTEQSPVQSQDELPSHTQEELPRHTQDDPPSDSQGDLPVQQYDFVICNAVLHFAAGHSHFEAMFGRLVKLMSPGGILFIRMTSTIGLEDKIGNGNEGVYALPDGSTRYLLTRAQVDELIREYGLKLIEPVKTVFVDGLRSMTTLVFSR